MEGELILSAGTVQATPFLDRLAPARAAGFSGVSIFAADVEAMVARGIDAEEIGRRAADAGLAISEVEIVGNWLPGASRKPGVPGWLIDLLARMSPERVVAMAAAIGARGLSAGDMLDVDCDLDAVAERFAAMCDLAQDEGLYVALEFIPTGRVGTLEDGWEVVRRAGRSNGGLLIDSWHFFRSGSSLELLASLPPQAIMSVQIGDAPSVAEADLDYEMAHGRLLPGDGELDLEGFVTALTRAGSRAPIAVEVFSDALAGEPIGAVAGQCADAARRLLGRRAYT